MEASTASSLRRVLGAYYTPQDIAAILSSWALRANPGPVLDPSYGICRFLTAALEVLTSLGLEHPERAIHGIDVDATATASTTRALLTRGARTNQFVHQDFFEVQPQPRFAAVLGNPPYVRHHWQSSDVKGAASDAMRDAGVSMSGRASLWAPFVVHADRFLRPGGRLAMLLPGAAIQADYAATLWEHLAQRYTRVTLARVGERAFPDALEETVVLLADERTGRGKRVPLAIEIDSFAALARELTEDPVLEQARKRGRRPGRVRDDLITRRLLTIAAEHDACVELGEVAKVRIGTVTGANTFFVREPADPLVRNLPEHEVQRVVPGSHALKGTTWTADDDARCASAGQRCRLLTLDGTRNLAGQLAAAISAAEKQALDERSHCRRRDPWWAIDPGPAPDAFLAYMAGTPKGLVINRVAAGCINGVHRVTWLVPDGDAYVLSTWTSLWCLAVEQQSRHYAGGVLKLEPGKAPNLPVVKHHDLDALAQLDQISRTAGTEVAREYADDLVLRGILGFSDRQVAEIRRAAMQLRRRRSPGMRPDDGARQA